MYVCYFLGSLVLLGIQRVGKMIDVCMRREWEEKEKEIVGVDGGVKGLEVRKSNQ